MAKASDSINAQERAKHIWPTFGEIAKKACKPGPWFGSLGLCTRAEVYYPDVPLRDVFRFISEHEQSISLLDCRGKNQAEDKEQKFDDIATFLRSLMDPSYSTSGLCWAKKVEKFRDFQLELSLLITSVSRESLDIQFVWTPELAFLDCEQPEERFLTIMSYFFDIQRKLHASKVFVCTVPTSATPRNAPELRVEV